MKQKMLSMNFFQLFPPDDSSEDYYHVSDYYMFLQLLGDRAKHEIVRDSLIIVADIMS